MDSQPPRSSRRGDGARGERSWDQFAKHHDVLDTFDSHAAVVVDSQGPGYRMHMNSLLLPTHGTGSVGQQLAGGYIKALGGKK